MKLKLAQCFAKTCRLQTYRCDCCTKVTYMAVVRCCLHYINSILYGNFMKVSP